ncbi:MAG TPA: YIP1 family protein [Bacteroidales bacterium]|jgi:hypothetical protein|nr:YIP1 family protein [Bacteroidales bacterium]HPB26133.1 YIP1 family protein [Bacteroidales bacterium]HPI30756.1 YIP1 family protein [Bacteroidales bacterium]HQP15075.1 YIP1 family protein [Bacteroidales bacterium]
MGEIICPQCKATLAEHAKFCHVCGYKLLDDNAQLNDTAQPNDTVEDKTIDMKDFTDVHPEEVMTAIKSGNIFKRAINIMFKPKTEWEGVTAEKPRVPMLIFGYSLVFAIIPVVSLILGYGLIGHKITVAWDNSFGIGFMQAFVFILASFTAIIVGAVVINAMAPAFKTEKNFGRAMQLTTYSFTPVFFAGALFFFPFLSVLANLAGLYGVFVLLIGLPIVMRTPKNDQIGYFFASIGVLFGIYYTVKWTLALTFALASSAMWHMHYSF